MTVDVCFTPALLHLFDLEGKTVVVVDIFRASSSICYGLDNGAVEIIPVSTVDECLEYAGQGYLLAAERDGQVVDGFDFGNSPFSYTAPKVSGRKIVLTTTNGTHALNLARKAAGIIIGSFLNLTALCNFLLASGRDVILLCSGWKDQFNLEDTVFAGAVCAGLASTFALAGDPAVASLDLYQVYKNDLNLIIERSSHSQRLKKLGILKDAIFCLQTDLCSHVPVLSNGALV